MSDNDDYEPYQWQVGDPEDWGDSVGVPDIPYMGYINGDDDDDGGYRRPPRKTESQMLQEEAWRLRQDGRPDEALALINQALEHDDRDFENWNVKAIILEDKLEYENAIECYNEALRLKPNAKNVKNNKAYSLAMLADRQRYTDCNWQKGLDLVNEAFTLLSDDVDREIYFRVKGRMLEGMNRKIDAHVCYLLASGMTDRVEKINNERQILRDSKDTFINITGTNFYLGMAPLLENPVVNLIREPDNPHDSDAVRVEFSGQTVGYVANSPYTLIDEVKSATEIRDILKPKQKAKVMFVFADEYVIARLLR